MFVVCRRASCVVRRASCRTVFSLELQRGWTRFPRLEIELLHRNRSTNNGMASGGEGDGPPCSSANYTKT